MYILFFLALVVKNNLINFRDQRELLSGVNRNAKDSNARIKNWMTFLRNIKAYYQVCLNKFYFF